MIWKRAKGQIALGLDVDVCSRKAGRCGRKKADLDLSRITKIPLNKRSTLRSLAKSLGVSTSTLHRKFKLGLIRRHSNTLKPLLTESNKRKRLEFCISMLDQITLGDAQPKFTGMDNIVHIDEKWFQMTKKTKKYYLLPEEEDPVRTIQNKNYIGKVMLLIGVARPKFDAQGNVTFSGKIGIWPFVKEVPAARNSKNRSKGTMEIKSISKKPNCIQEDLLQQQQQSVFNHNLVGGRLDETQHEPPTKRSSAPKRAKEQI